MKTILAAVDFSGASESVVSQSIDLAQATHGRVVLLTVVQPPVINSEFAAPLLENYAEITVAAEKAAARNLHVIEQRVQSTGIQTEALQLAGSPVSLIVAEASKHSADYIVMGSHGQTAFYDLLVGSTTHGVLHQARCPVVIVPVAGNKDRGKTS